ncbi:ELMO domain-containing protein 2 [Ischnura elegans]|uniref:ELMO domain-containing protein 2 n=1 Tax=Ischnura elegans TaxID=197161 RepID=UPI001ED86A26|nr:ELMO domain-containing protein 2 [Ischnura elegans]
MLQLAWSYVYWYLRPILKWFLRRATKLCELQRICYGAPKGAQRTLGVESSMMNSRCPDIKRLVSDLNRISEMNRIQGENAKNVVNYAVFTVSRVKCIDLYVHDQFSKSFGVCVQQIWGMRQLLHEVERLRATPYDSSNPDHEEKLLLLWSLLKPEEPLDGRISKQWQDIGFQGDDPATDFRGMGMLGLENLLYFAREYPKVAQHVLSHSKHPNYGFVYAIVGINLTSMAYYLLRNGTSKTHFYNTCSGVPSLKLFHAMYSYLFFEFDKFWIKERPKNVMQFSIVRDKFEKNLKETLADPEAVLKLNFRVDDI